MYETVGLPKGNLFIPFNLHVESYEVPRKSFCDSLDFSRLSGYSALGIAVFHLHRRLRFIFCAAVTQ